MAKKNQISNSETFETFEPEPETGETHYLQLLYNQIAKRYDTRFNVLTKTPEISAKGENKYEEIGERQILDVWYDLQLAGVQERGKEIKIETLSRIFKISKFVKNYHAFQEYLNNLNWDGKFRIKPLANSLHIAEPEQKLIFPTLLKRWLINSAAIAIGLPAGQSHVMIILEGPQRKGKTSWLNNLLPECMQDYLYCGHIVPSFTEVNTANMLAEKWIINVDDQLQGLFSKDFNNIKSLITAPDVTNRKSYDRSSSKRQRTASFLASVNSKEIFTDIENRRYAVISIDPEKEFCYDKAVLNKIDIEQVWAEVMYELKAGEKINFTSDEISNINQINLHYHQTRPELEWLCKCFFPCNDTEPNAYPIQHSEILSQLNEVSGLKLNSMWLGCALEKAGFKVYQKKLKSYNNNSVRVFYVRRLFDEDPFKPGKYTFMEPVEQLEIFE